MQVKPAWKLAESNVENVIQADKGRH
jgi:hypothetical protein